MRGKASRLAEHASDIGIQQLTPPYFVNAAAIVWVGVNELKVLEERGCNKNAKNATLGQFRSFSVVITHILAETESLFTACHRNRNHAETEFTVSFGAETENGTEIWVHLYSS